MESEVEYRDLGLVEYGKCWQLQRTLFDQLIESKRTAVTQNQTNATCDATESSGWLLMVEHPAVYTLGKSGHSDNLLVSEEFLKSIGAEFFKIDRGGDITFHGPGQLVCYPIVDLEKLGIGLREYIFRMEQTVIDLAADYSVATSRIAGASGVWVEAAGRRAEKICAVGVKSSRFVTMHGIALNVNTDLRWFGHINPCGFTDRGVTSLARCVGREIDMQQVKSSLAAHFGKNMYVKIKY